MSVGARALVARPKLLLVGAGPCQLELLRAARRCAEVIVVADCAHAPGLALADLSYVSDTSDVAKIVELARALSISGVVSCASDAAVPAISAVVSALGLPGFEAQAALTCRDKLACFRSLRVAALPVPNTVCVVSVAQAEHAMRALGGLPVIVKPRRGAGGRGVTLVRAISGLAVALERARRANGPGPQGVLVQELIAGRSVGVEAFFFEGRLAAAFVLDDQFEAGYVSPAGHSLPSTLSPALQRTVVRAVARIGQTLGLCTGPANFDLRLRNGEAYLLEVNPRLGGNSISDLIRHAFGVELAEATVCAALGGDPRPLLARKKLDPTAARLILKQAHGVARLHDAAGPFAELADVIALDLLVSEAEVAPLRVNDWTILGRSLVRAADSGKAARLAERVAQAVAARIELQ